MTPLLPAAVALAAAGPAFLAVCEASEARPFGALASHAPACAAAAAAFCALCTAAELGVLGGGAAGFILLAPPVIGAAPWAAGELCTGPSRRQDESFAAAVVAAYGGALAGEWAFAAGPCAALLSGAAATAAYLSLRTREVRR